MFEYELLCNYRGRQEEEDMLMPITSSLLKRQIGFCHIVLLSNGEMTHPHKRPLLRFSGLGFSQGLILYTIEGFFLLLIMHCFFGIFGQLRKHTNTHEAGRCAGKEMYRRR